MIIKLQENTIFIDDNAVNTFNFLIKRKTKKKKPKFFIGRENQMCGSKHDIRCHY